MRVRASLLVVGTLVVAASCAPEPALLAREAWGALPPISAMRPHRIERITIHHTAVRHDPGRPLAVKLRALQAFSRSEGRLADGSPKRAWPDLPYHLYVDLDGRVGEGRPLGYAGDTNTAYDPTGHLLIVLEGNFEEEEPTAAQMDALGRLVAGHAERFSVPPERIEGHRDHADTLCPGERLYRRLPELRARVARGRPG